MIELAKDALKVLLDPTARKRFMGYRPVVSCIITTREQPAKMLLIRPAADSEIWIPPQEGINPDESYEQAAIRCLETELGIPEDRVQYRRIQYTGDIIFPDSRKGERDLEKSFMTMRGKSYFFALIYTNESLDITINNAEVAEYKWVELTALDEYLSGVDTKKTDLIKKAINKFFPED